MQQISWNSNWEPSRHCQPCINSCPRIDSVSSLRYSDNFAWFIPRKSCFSKHTKNTLYVIGLTRAHFSTVLWNNTLLSHVQVLFIQDRIQSCWLTQSKLIWCKQLFQQLTVEYLRESRRLWLHNIVPISFWDSFLSITGDRAVILKAFCKPTEELHMEGWVVSNDTGGYSKAKEQKIIRWMDGTAKFRLRVRMIIWREFHMRLTFNQSKYAV